MNPLRMVFVGPDASAFTEAMDALAADGHQTQCVTSPFKALTANTRAPADLTIIDASRLDDQMLEVFEALKDVAPNGLLLAAVTPAARGRAARVLNLGSDAIVGLPADGDEIRALLAKLLQPAHRSSETVSVDQKFQWLGEFAGGVAHNINNPLTTVVGYLQILRAQAESTDQVSSVLSIMLKECDRISDIVKNLLLFSGNGNLQPRPIDVNRAVDSALLLSGAAEENGRVRIERSYQPSLPSVMADEEALKLACENIAVNARQAMREGGVLSVATAEDGAGHVLIRFTDTGPGIERTHLGKIFEPFYSGGNNGSVGLGLATSYGIIKGFGGTIKVASEDGEGATFEVELPAGV